MFKNYIYSLIDNIDQTNIPKNINIIIDGGAFAGGQLTGCLNYIKELERLKLTKVNKISGCSVGALLGYMYLTDTLSYAPRYFNILLSEARKKVQLKKITKLIKLHINNTDYKSVNNKLYISYNNIDTLEHIIISQFNSQKEIIDKLISSSFIPLLFDGKIQYKNKYCDGITPYIFNKSNNSNLFISLVNLYDFKEMIYCKNDVNIWHRQFVGLDDIHCFFKNTNKASKFCSFIEKWKITDFIMFGIRELIHMIIIIILKYYSLIYSYINIYIKDNIFYKRINSFIILLIQRFFSYNIF